jgi:hypothetical protein
MSARDDPSVRSLPTRKPKDRLRPWSTYGSAGEYYADYRGYVPIQMMIGISQVMRERGVTFVEAYRLLLEAGAIIEIDQVCASRGS